MNKLGQIKSKIEKGLVSLYGKPSFKPAMKKFKETVLSNKTMAEAFYIYDELNSKKGMNPEIVSDYLSESFEKLNSIIEKNQRDIQTLSDWADELIGKEVENDYSDIDYVLYEKSFKNLEKVLESKNRIKKNIITENVEQTITESINLPLSTMLKIASNTFNQEYGNIEESEKEELKSLLSMSTLEIQSEMLTLRESVVSKLQGTLNENEDKELIESLTKTIQKINESENDLVNLYKLRQLNSGL
tara:strand:- start:4351 stop:5085 length:735 start_codon:yes stop_codon:yes gene_type:complete